MRPIETLKNASGKSSTGGTPSFTPAHVLIALEGIDSGKGIGRQKLSRRLRLGEGMMRTLVRRLKALDLIETSRGGMSLTPAGESLLNELNGVIKAANFPPTPITVGVANFAVLVKGAASKVKRGIEQRDAAIMVGAQGATSLIMQDGRLRMPGMDETIDAEIERIIHQRMELIEGDVLIIGSSDDPFLAEIGAKSAALMLLES
ncbi:MAG: DUF4443 domain-containing protein [Candidatus Bathyarchaeota archaeon]|nr:DUF4443 domain-containing protein [Candidatus Bathyarchaeota archaeon]